MSDSRSGEWRQRVGFPAALLAAAMILVVLAPGVLTDHHLLASTHFDRIEMGCPVEGESPIWGPYASWYPADIDGDGTWELAVLTAEEPRRCGVFDPTDGGWVWGPVTVPAAPYQWGVGDWNDDGFAEYVYMSLDTVVHFDSHTSTRTPLWVVTVPPRLEWPEPRYVLASWGSTPGGAPVIGVLEERWESASHCPDGLEQSWYWQVHDLFTGDSVTSVPAGLGGRHVHGLIPGATTSLVLLEAFQEVCCCDQFNPGWWTQKARIVDAQWQTVAAFDLPGESDNYASMVSCLWGLVHADAGHVLGDEQPLLVWHSRPRPMFGSCGSLPYCMGVERITDSLSLWELQFNLSWTPFHTPAAYMGMAAFDVNEDGTDELIVTLSTGEGWEIKDIATGDWLDTIPGMPAVDLRTGPLFESGTRELFYLSGTGLYVWSPDVVTAVGDEESSQRLPTQMTLTAAPNPFNAAVLLTWSAAEPPRALEIYNVLGQRVRTFDLSGHDMSGALTWDGGDPSGCALASGLYMARLVSGSESTVVKLVLLK